MSVVINPRCRFCGKHKHAQEFIVNPVVGMCFECLQWQKKQHDVLLGRAPVPAGCDACRKTYEQLEAFAPGGDVLFALVPIDGTFAWLCLPCEAEYVRKRKDVYGKTPYGATKA
jgi:hypothetical protein